ncbi:hypothetical protein GCM10028857_21790 [Salinarchaeum chitinilyticum]
MRVQTRLRLLRIAGLVLTVPIAFLLFTVAVSVDAGAIVGLLIVFVPLGLYAAGVALLLRGLGDPTDGESRSGAV